MAKVIDKTEATRAAKAMGLSSAVTLVPGIRLTKADQEFVISSPAREKEEFFPSALFERGDNKALVKTPFNFHALEHLTLLNNSLNQAISAMEVNIDATGYVIEKETANGKFEMVPKDKTAQGFRDFFDEPVPGMSFTTIRRQIRRDQESTGNAFMEVIRSVAGEVTFLRRIDPKQIRMVQLDDPVTVTKRVERFGKELDVMMLVRERRYAQALALAATITMTDRTGGDAASAQATTGGPRVSPNEKRKARAAQNLVYFKEFGASRDLDKWTGDWADKDQKLPAEDRATELIHFKVIEDVHTKYGLPRWINQTPSVLGSRKAEELNLSFFNSGGIPPVLVVVEGGELTTRVRENLQQYLWNNQASKHQAAIVEAHQTGGDLNSTNNVRIKVERFGSEKQRDSMFENYDDKCERRVRSSFRLAPIFVGRTEEYNFATAFASYVVGEAQVFKPERSEFDETIDNTIMVEFNRDHGKGSVYRYRSLPLQTVDIQSQIRALNVAKDVADPDSLVEVINEKAELGLRPMKGDPQPRNRNGARPDQIEDPMPGRTRDNPDNSPEDQESNDHPRTGQSAAKVQKIDPIELIQLAQEWADATRGGWDAKHEPLYERVVNLSTTDSAVFNAYVARHLLPGDLHAPEQTTEIMTRATRVAARPNGEAG
jgi:capsid portal protein